MNWTYVLLVAILVAIVLFNGEAVHQLHLLRAELREEQAKRFQEAFNRIVRPPKEPPKPRKPAMPRI